MGSAWLELGIIEPTDYFQYLLLYGHTLFPPEYFEENVFFSGKFDGYGFLFRGFLHSRANTPTLSLGQERKRTRKNCVSYLV